VRERKTRISIGLAIALAILASPASGQYLSPFDVDKLPSKPADARVAYGGEPMQFGDLRLPAGPGPFALVVVIHGGCWRSIADLENTAPMADALRDVGVATWNIEYRPVDKPGGGWPGTFDDVANAVDHVRALAEKYPLDTARVLVAGHSAGAHLALWTAARSRLPADSALRRATPLPIVAAVALGGPGDLRDFATYGSQICGPVLEQLMGGGPELVAERWAQASPAELLPLGVRQVLIVGEADRVMPARARDAYAARARTAGDAVEVKVVAGAHFEVIAPGTPAFVSVRDSVLALLGVPR
jgi:acetyl esterase/lipase